MAAPALAASAATHSSRKNGEQPIMAGVHLHEIVQQRNAKRAIPARRDDTNYRSCAIGTSDETGKVSPFHLDGASGGFAGLQADGEAGTGVFHQLSARGTVSV